MWILFFKHVCVLKTSLHQLKSLRSSEAVIKQTALQLQKWLRISLEDDSLTLLQRGESQTEGEREFGMTLKLIKWFCPHMISKVLYFIQFLSH